MAKEARVMGSKSLHCVLWCAVLVLAAGMLSADMVNVCFWSDGGLRIVQTDVAPGRDLVETALSALVLGPSDWELAAGITSAIPRGTMLSSIKADGKSITIDFSDKIISGRFGDAELEAILEQVKLTLRMVGVDKDIRLTTGGLALASYLPPTPRIAPRVKTGTADDKSVMGDGTALSGHSITVNPGHGYVWAGSGWGWQRGITCTTTGLNLIYEDWRNLDHAQYLEQYLLSDGMTVKVTRCTDKNYGNHPATGKPWWQIAACYWLQNTGYPCSVYGSSTGCTLGSGDYELNDDIRSRPLSSDYDDTDIMITLHTNAYSGDCTGSCPTGSDIYYDCSTEHATWCDVSRDLEEAVYPAFLDAVQNRIPDADWNNHGVHEDTAGNYGEIRIPDRAAILLEMGFHDTCDHDALHLADEFFKCAAMWGIYKGVCDYFGVTPTWDFYSDELVSHDIPATMAPGVYKTVHLKFKNRGVLWNSARNFKLGAVDDSDPFTATTRHTLSSEVAPGSEYTFTFELHAPATTGSYTTDWRMLRESYQWFGATCSQNVQVTGTMDTQAPTVPTNLAGYAPSQTQVDLTWTASTDNVEVAGYKIYRGGNLVGTSPTPSYSDTTCSANTTYSYSVLAYDTTHNESAQCTAVQVTTPPYIEIIIDEDGATYSGSWSYSSGAGSAAYNGDYKYATTASSETAWAKWTPNLTRTGNWAVYIYYREGSNRSVKAPYTIYYNGGSQAFSVNQTTGGGQWNYLATKPFNSGTAGYTKLGNGTGESGKVVIADAVRYYFVSDPQNAPPTITGQPSAQNVCPGATANFTVTATGPGTLTYQWQKNQSNLSNSGHYSGVTTATLTVSNCDANDAANYRCVVSNAYGSTNSNEAALTLKTTTAITGQPQNQTVAAGATAYFSVTATGSGTLAYQWQKNQSNLSNGGHYSGVTTSTLTISNCDSNDAANYRCVVTGDCGTATSNEATLTVTGAPPTRLFDNFDSYAAQANFTAAWPIDVSPGGTLSTAQYYSSPKSIYITTAAARNKRSFTSYYGTDANPLIFSIRIYDITPANLNRQYVEIQDSSPSITQILNIGMYNSLESMRTHYSARVAYSPGPGWVVLDDASAPHRSVGWHEIKAVIKSTTIDYYVDGVLSKSGVAYGTSVGQHTFELAKIGSGYSSTTAAYYDDFSLVGGL